jgi:hypothetical protein
MSDQQCFHALPTLMQQEKSAAGNRVAPNKVQDAHAMKLQDAVNHTRQYIEKVNIMQEQQRNLFMSRAQITLPSISPTRGNRCSLCLF